MNAFELFFIEPLTREQREAELLQQQLYPEGYERARQEVEESHKKRVERRAELFAEFTAPRKTLWDTILGWWRR